jgi:L-2-hydroxyglutarate oxidase LhgO
MAQMYQSGRYCKAPIKVYGKASVGAPPMSVPHIDSRMINGEKQHLAFCWFSTRFLKMDPIQTCLYP